MHQSHALHYPLSAHQATHPVLQGEGAYITWGLCHHGDSLWSAADEQYESALYTQPPPGPPTGSVLRIRLGEGGGLLGSSKFTKVRQ